MKQTNLTQMFNKMGTNTPLLLRSCASKNSLKTLFKVNAQAKISHCKGVFVVSIEHLGPTCLLHDAKIRSCKGGVVIAIGIIFRNLRILAYVWDFSVALKSE